MTVLGVIIGIFVMAILVIHIYLTNNVMEKNCADLRDEVIAYYGKKLDVVVEEEQENEE